MDDDFYTLNEVIEILEHMKEKKSGIINLPKTAYCLALEIRELKEYIGYLHEIIPTKYKKLFSEPEENPFFSKNDLKPNYITKEERENSLVKMKEFEEKYRRDYPDSFKQQNEAESSTFSD